MFDLERAVSDWRRRMVDCGFKPVEVINELESHLRDDIDTQVRSGVNEERAFELSVRRLGTPAELKKEFAKSPQPEVAQRRTFLGYFYFICATVAILIDLWSLISFDLSLGGRVGAGAGVALFALYLFGLPIWSPWRSGTLGAYFLGALKVIGIIAPLWVLFALLTALRILHWEIGIIPEMTMWSLCAAYGLTALAWAAGFGGRGGSGGVPLLTSWPIPPSPLLPPYVDIPIPPSMAFTPAARRALELAREEALGLGHDFVGTEHVLLGLLRTAGGALSPVLQLNKEVVRTEVCRLVSAFPVRPAAAELPLTPRARKALQFAGREAVSLKRSPIGSEHILLGLLLEGSGVAAVALRNLGIRLEQFRAQAGGGRRQR